MQEVSVPATQHIPPATVFWMADPAITECKHQVTVSPPTMVNCHNIAQCCLHCGRKHPRLLPLTRHLMPQSFPSAPGISVWKGNLNFIKQVCFKRTRQKFYKASSIQSWQNELPQTWKGLPRQTLQGAKILRNSDTRIVVSCESCSMMLGWHCIWAGNHWP
jgi:hypothetical protein